MMYDCVGRIDEIVCEIENIISTLKNNPIYRESDNIINELFDVNIRLKECYIEFVRDELLHCSPIEWDTIIVEKAYF